jgi:hypothetical protein
VSCIPRSRTHFIFLSGFVVYLIVSVSIFLLVTLVYFWMFFRSLYLILFKGQKVQRYISRLIYEIAGYYLNFGSEPKHWLWSSHPCSQIILRVTTAKWPWHKFQSETQLILLFKSLGIYNANFILFLNSKKHSCRYLKALENVFCRAGVAEPLISIPTDTRIGPTLGGSSN